MKEWIYDTYSRKLCRKLWCHGQKMRKLFWREKKEFCLQLCWIRNQVSLSGDTLKLGKEIRAKDVDCRVISKKDIVEAELCLVTQSCPTLCNPMVCSPPGSSVHWILQARILEWVAIPFSKRSSQPRDRTQVSCIAGRFFTVLANGVMVQMLLLLGQRDKTGIEARD